MTGVSGRGAGGKELGLAASDFSPVAAKKEIPPLMVAATRRGKG